jgi:hypothetical protein
VDVYTSEFIEEDPPQPKSKGAAPVEQRGKVVEELTRSYLDK